MLLRISLVISLVNICSCATPTYPEGASNQAVYSQSFHRDDVPVSYKYSAVHIYTQPPKNEEPSKIMNNGIQYAPLSFQLDEQTQKQQQTYAKHYTESTTQQPTESAGNNKHLEPKVVPNNPTYHPGLNKYIPGQNVRVLQSSVRTPAHTFRFIPHTERNIKERDMTDYMKEFLLYQEPQTVATAGPMTFKPNLVHMFETPKPTLHTSIYKPQPNHQINLYMLKDLNLPPTLTYHGHDRQKLSAKVPQVHLNIGQEQKFPLQQRTQNTHLDQARFYAYPMKGPELFVNPQKKKAPSDTKQLRPIPNHLHLSAYSRT